MKNIFQIVVDMGIVIRDIEGIDECLSVKMDFETVTLTRNSALRILKRYGCCKWTCISIKIFKRKI